MPPRKLLPPFIELSNDRQKARCKICSATAASSNDSQWITYRGVPAHLASSAHEKAASLHCQRQKYLAAVEKSMEEANNLFRNPGTREHAAAALLPCVTILPSQSREKGPSALEEELWDTEEHYQPEDFDMGTSGIDEHDRKKFLRDLETFGWNLEAGNIIEFENSVDDDLTADPELDDTLTNVMRQNLIREPDGQDIRAIEFGESIPDVKNSAWYPYPSKTLFLLDTIDSLPRLRISDSMMKIILWLLQESGVRDVPSLAQLHAVQKRLRECSGIPTLRFQSVHGNIFFMNDIRTLVAKDYSNPLVRPHIHIYPEIPDGPISEVWHAEKWRKEIDPALLTPMYQHGSIQYYVNELARLKSGAFVIPIRWLTWKGAVYADAYEVVFSENGIATIAEGEALICAAHLDKNLFDLQDFNEIPSFSDDSTLAQHVVPNSLRDIAEGETLYSSQIDLFGDDVSGNRSKSWNKHLNTYFTHRNLPRKLLQQEFHVHFLSSSPDASVSEQIQAFKQLIESTHTKPIHVRDAATGQGCRVRLFLNAEPSDNPMQSEECSHMGGQANFSCRKCHAGGTDEFKGSNDGFHSLFLPGTPRNASETLREVKYQISTACMSYITRVREQQTLSGIKDIYTEPWIDYLVQEAKRRSNSRSEDVRERVRGELMMWVEENEAKIYNGNLQMPGFDPNRDTPVEILHTILLGIVKYTWYYSHSAWSPKEKEIYAQRLQATDTNGLSIPPIRANYIMQYANSLIGRQLKTVGQTSIFHVFDILKDPHLLILWKAVGSLMALLWTPEIDDMDQYTADVSVAVANVLDAFALVDPSKILTKLKLHLLAHIPEDIRRFGPLIGMATEIYECFNAIFRFCSILSNHQSPSRDIALQLADQEGFKHRITGGWWRSADGNGNGNGDWEQASANVRDFLQRHPTLQGQLGWSQKNADVPGFVRLCPVDSKDKTTAQVDFGTTAAAKAVNAGAYAAVAEQWTPGKYLVAASQDRCTVGSWVFAKSPVSEPVGNTIVGRLTEILQGGSGSPSHAIAVLDVFSLSQERHPVFDMPRLVRRFGETSLLIVPVTMVQFIVNVQHDCSPAGCTASGVRPVRQERADSSRNESYVVHQPLQEFVLNLHALHNAHLVRRAIPRSLWAPIPFFATDADRRKEHDKMAATYRERHAQRRSAQNAQKRQRKEQATAAGHGSHADAGRQN